MDHSSSSRRRCCSNMLLTLVTLLATLCDAYEEWAVHIPTGMEAAKKFAEQHGVVMVAEIIPDSNVYQFVHQSRGKRSVHNMTKRILDDELVYWAEKQEAKIRTKRDASAPTADSYEPSIVDSEKINDPSWKEMWYLNRPGGLHMNVAKAWNMGLTGKGIAVTILDDGIEKDHPDLLRNYDPLASTDINDNDSDPNPRYDFSDSNRHGTRCAGQVAASPNNSVCGIGIAYNSQIGGIRMLDGQVSDAVEARSLSFNPDHIHIYSSSWGPNDDGKTVDGPGKLASRAFKNGITRGREGKGSIFVWASGNGGRYKDNCNCDGYATSIYTITVSSTSESGNIPWYSEACSATIATTYSSGTTAERQIVTTDLHHGCTVKHTGTSASAPMAAAIIALTLEANPDLSWRDMQHIIVRTSRPLNLKAPDWMENAMGRMVSHSYGYGLMDAAEMGQTAKQWKMVPKQETCVVSSPYYEKMIPAMGYVTVELDVKECPNIRHLEHVVIPTYVTAGRKRGDLRIYLQSPSGTRSTLLDVRPQDYSSSGFIDWPFMSVHHWGENPTGTWILEVHNDAFSKWASEAKFHKWSLELYGIKYDPNSHEYADERFNVVREANLEVDEKPKKDQQLGVKEETKLLVNTSTTTSSSTTTPTVIPTTESKVIDRGCVSKQIHCTKNITDCRTFTHRSVADVFCGCTPSCLEVASLGVELYNMQCDMDNDSSSESSGKKPPFFCQFIPFFSY